MVTQWLALPPHSKKVWNSKLDCSTKNWVHLVERSEVHIVIEWRVFGSGTYEPLIKKRLYFTLRDAFFVNPHIENLQTSSLTLFHQIPSFVFKWFFQCYLFPFAVFWFFFLCNLRFNRNSTSVRNYFPCTKHTKSLFCALKPSSLATVAAVGRLTAVLKPSLHFGSVCRSLSFLQWSRPTRWHQQRCRETRGPRADTLDSVETLSAGVCTWEKRRRRVSEGGGSRSSATHVAPGAEWSPWLWQEDGRNVCVWVSRGACWGQRLVPRLHHRTMIPFSAERSRAVLAVFFVVFFPPIPSAPPPSPQSAECGWPPLWMFWTVKTINQTETW